MTKTCIASTLNRREWLSAAAGAGVAARALAAPVSPVAVARCPSYGQGVLPALRKMLDQLGGVGKQISGKTVAIKINMSNPLRDRTGYRPAWFTRWSHPDVIGAAISLFGQAGAARIRILEGSSEDAHPLEENFLIGGCDPSRLLNAAKNVEMENTSFLGLGKQYSRLKVPGGGYIYPGFDLNHSYAECDFFVSITKLKEHRVAGVSLSMKNLIGATPATIYGDAAGFDEPAEQPFGERTILHKGHRQPSLTAPSEKDPKSPREPGYRIPRITADLVGARPIHLAIIDGIESQTASEGTTVDSKSKRTIRQVKPGILIAGLNPVCTDAVATALMGFDPLAVRGKAPFETCDSTLALAEEAGLGTRDLSKIEVIGTSVRAAQFLFRGQP